MGFQTREALNFFLNISKKFIVLEFEIELFFHFFVAFEDRKDIING
jgi:hypothetical protein